MGKTNILVVEDDIIIASDIALNLRRLNYEIVGVLARGEDAVVFAQDSPPDIVLMDIQLKGKMTGVEAAKKILDFNKDVIIVYLTSNTDEATYNKAKNTRPHAFISKPFKPVDLGRAIELALLRKQEITEQKHHNNINPNGSEIDLSNGYILSDRIFVKFKNRMIKLFIRDILYAEAERNYCKIFLENREHLLTMTLKAFEQKLSVQNFIRIHRSFVINLNKIDSLSDNCHFVNIGDKAIPVGKNYKEALTNRLKMI